MESAGKNVDDEELREAMKENGIGRPSTRAAIIETLFKRRYIYRERKNIMVSQAGIDLIATIQDELLKSAKLTGIWENKLRRIERGEYQASEFIGELKELINTIVINVLSDNSSHRIAISEDKAEETDSNKKRRKTSDSAKSSKTGTTRRKKKVESLDQIVCPLCKKGHIIKGRTAYGCSRYADGCTCRLPFEQYPADLTPQQLADKISKQ